MKRQIKSFRCLDVRYGSSHHYVLFKHAIEFAIQIENSETDGEKEQMCLLKESTKDRNYKCRILSGLSIPRDSS